MKLRSDQVRASRIRMASLTFGVLFGTVLSFYLLFCVGRWGLNYFVYTNPAFAIKNIEVQTDGVISVDQLRRWADVKLGQNLLALDLGDLKRRVENVPAIASVSVERVLPGTLRLRVTEREAVAQVNVRVQRPSGQWEVSVFHLDPDGFVMMPLDPRQRSIPVQQTNDPLPLVSGVGGNATPPGQRVESPQIQAALRLITEFAYSPMAGVVDLKRIDVSSPEVLVVTTGQSSEVTFGLNDLDRQLRRWREIYDQGRRVGRTLATLDLAVTNNVPASWLEASSAPPPPAKAPHKLRTRRKNV